MPVAHPLVPNVRQLLTDIFVTLATSNLIGMTFARSLHYQFYSWYALQLPLLVWESALWWPLKCADADQDYCTHCH